MNAVKTRNDADTPMTPKRPKKTLDHESDDKNSSSGSETSSTASQMVSGVVPGAAKMTFDGGALSDDEANSWEDSVSESDGSVRGGGGDDYYDQEDYDDEAGSPSPRKEGPEEEYGSEDEGAPG